MIWHWLDQERALRHHRARLDEQVLAQHDHVILGKMPKVLADRDSLLAALQATCGPRAGQLADARVGRLRSAGIVAPSMQPAGEAAV